MDIIKILILIILGILILFLIFLGFYYVLGLLKLRKDLSDKVNHFIEVVDEVIDKLEKEN